MIIKKIVSTIILSSAAFSLGLAHVGSAATDPAIISNEWEGNKDNVVYATRNDGSMAMAYPAADGSGVYYYLYNKKTATWSDVDIIENPEFDGATYAKIKDLALVDLPTISEDNNAEYEVFVPSWISEYYMTGEDGSEVFLGAKYNWDWYDSYQPKNAPENTATQPDESIMHVQPAGGSSFWGFWNMNGTLYSQLWDRQDEWEDSELGSMSTIASPEDFKTISVRITDFYNGDYSNEYIFSSSTGSLMGGKLNQRPSTTGGSAEAYLSTTFTIAENAELLDLTKDSENNIYILYRQGGDIKRQLLHTADDTLSGEITVMKNVNPRTVSVAYNDYGDGQYVVLVSTYDGDTATLRYSMENASGWTKGETFYTKNHVLAEPQLRTFNTGHIQFVWSYNNTWRYKEYSPETKAWSDNQKIAKHYDGKRLINPLRQSPVRSTDGKFYIERLRQTIDAQQQVTLQKWNLGSDITNTASYDLPAGYKQIFHEVNGDYHFIIIQKDNTLKSIIATETDLFGE